jgi:carbamoyl-phosphate synthase large subunit
MIVVGGMWQVPLVKTAKSMGLYIINSNLYQDSPAFEYADVTWVCDVKDKQKNLECAMLYKPDAVLTDQSDIGVKTVAWLCERLNLPGIGVDVAELFVNKSVMRDFCKSNGFSIPKYKQCYTFNEAADFLKAHRKIVIKPIDSQSSRGVFIIETLIKVEEVFETAMQFSNAEEAVLVEEFIDGPEFTVDGIKLPDGYYTLAISEKTQYRSNPMISSSLLFSNYNNTFDYEALRRMNHEIVRVSGLPFGLTHGEYKYSDGKFYLVEIAARGGGTKISSDITKYMSGIDSNELLIRMALGESVSTILPPPQERYAILQFINFRPGKVKKILGVETVLSMPGVIDFGLNFTAGDTISRMTDDRSRPGYYIASAKEPAILQRLCEEIESTINIAYE